MDRLALLKDLVAYHRPVAVLVEDLRRFPWDRDGPLLELTAANVLAMLYRFCCSECTNDEMQLWANAIECRDDIGYDPTSVTGSILHELANPFITTLLSMSRAWELISQLRESGEIRAVPDFCADISLVPTTEGGRKMALPSVEWKTVLGINGELWSAVLRYEGNPLPGSTFAARVNLLYPNKCLALFTLGAHFTVWEGGTRAKGHVTALKDD